MTSGAYDVLSEHQHIRRQVDALESALDKRNQGGSAWLDELVPLLRELSTGLASHFRGEEAEFFEDVSRRLPRHSATVERLIEQHKRLTQDFASVADQAGALNTSGSEGVEQFATSLTKTLKLLRTHEEQENELMLVAYWQDLGEAD